MGSTWSWLGAFLLGAGLGTPARSVPATGARDDATPAPLVTLRGHLQVYDEDDAGKVLAVSLWTEHRGELVVAPDGKGPELLGLVGAEVKLRCRIEEPPQPDDDDALPVIHVEDYTVLGRGAGP